MDFIIHSLIMIAVALCVGALISWLMGRYTRSQWRQIIQLAENNNEKKRGGGWLEDTIRAQTNAPDLKISSDASTESDSRDTTPSNTHSGR